MYEALADIEALSLSCHSEQSKEYIAEAIKCYRSGAYRAAIVSTWIAVVFDLIDKIRELSLSGDAAAQVIETQYQKYITQIQNNDPLGVKGALEFERSILETCKEKLQFFDATQFLELDRLQADRHRCAHPSFQQQGIPFMPSAELARLHIRNAIVYVLAQPPVQGKAALARLELVISSAYFPLTIDGVKAQLEANGLKRPTPALIKALVDKLVLEFADVNKPLFYKQNVLNTLEALHELHTGIAAERFSIQLNKVIRLVPDSELYAAAYMVGNSARYLGDVLEQASKVKLEAFIKTATHASAIGELQNVEALRIHVTQRISTFDVNQLADLTLRPSNHNLAKEPVLQLLSRAYHYAAVNDIINRTLLPIFGSLTVEDIHRIVKMPDKTNADLRGANAFPLLANKVVQTGLIPFQEFNQLLAENSFRVSLVPPPPVANALAVPLVPPVPSSSPTVP